MSENDTSVLPTGPEPGTPAGGKRRTGLIVGGAAALVLIGGGAFATWNLLAAKGPAPEEALPASTLAVATVDLDPSAGQKVAAYKTIRKFPGLKKELTLDDDDDLRKVIFDKVQEEGGCTGLSYKDDVEPWLGKRAAIAAVDLGAKEPSPVSVIQVTDKEAATEGFKDLVKACGDSEDGMGYVVTDDFLVISDTLEHAKDAVAAGEKKPLSDDPTYIRWSDELGDAGVLNVYVARKAIELLTDLAESESPELKGKDAFGDAAKSFKGAAGTLRFSDGGLEFAAVGGVSSKYVGDKKIGSLVEELPSDTAIALGFGVPSDYAKTILEQVRSTLGADVVDAQLTQMEAETGLELPEDLQTLLGEGLAVVLGGDAPKSLAQVTNPADVPAGILLKGDAAGMRKVLDKVEKGTGMQLAQLGVATRDNGDKLALATSDGFANKLLKKGSLGDQAGFASVVPEAGKSTSLLYIDFDSSWVDALLGTAKDMGAPASVEANVKPLKGFGISTWSEGDTFRALLKLTTD